MVKLIANVVVGINLFVFEKQNFRGVLQSMQSAFYNKSFIWKTGTTIKLFGPAGYDMMAQL